MLDLPSSPAKAANHLNRIAKCFYDAHGGNRFPVNIDQLTLNCAEIFHWPDPIIKIEDANIPNFEGMLTSNEDRSKWMIVYNSSLSSQGRIRFTKAHELGHYVLHRVGQSSFSCSRDDMLDWTGAESIETQADQFASYLLMPLDDFRKQVDNQINLDVFRHCSERYGVSMTAAILKWLSYTEEKAILVMSNDGFINWASSSDSAFKAGAYFKTRGSVIQLPPNSLAANSSVNCELHGINIPLKFWFPHADSDSEIKEMKVYSAQHDCTLSLLLLPRNASCWSPKK